MARRKSPGGGLRAPFGNVRRVREESHLDDMRSAIRGDFERLAKRLGGQDLMSSTTEVSDAEDHEDVAHTREAAPAEVEQPKPDVEAATEGEPDSEGSCEPESASGTRLVPPFGTEPEPPSEAEPQPPSGAEPEPPSEAKLSRSWLSRLLGLS